VQVRRVVDVDVQAGQLGRRVDQFRPVLLLQLPAAQHAQVDPALCSHQPERQLLARHLQREHDHRLRPRHASAIVEQRRDRRRHVPRDGEDPRRLTHAGPPRNDGQLLLVEPQGYLVQLVQPGGDARRVPLAVRRGDLVVRGRDHLRQRGPVVAALVAVGQPADQPLGVVDEPRGLDGAGVPDGLDLRSQHDGVAHAGQVVHGASVGLDVRHRGGRVENFR
jgi:hypothetical protein